MEKIPILRFGEIYESNAKREVYDCENNSIFEISMAIPIIFKTDIMKRSKVVSCKLRNTSITQIIKWVKKAGKIFASEDLNIAGTSQSPQDYCNSVARITGMPKHMSMDILNDFQKYMENIDEIISKQFRIDNLKVLDTFKTSFNSMIYGITPKADILCAVMPGNHPIVNMMWIIAFAMKYPIVIKPSFDDPYTPLRLIYSLMRAGADKEFFSFYPVNHSDVTDLLKVSGCGIIFGGNDVKEIYKNYPSVRVYGPGNSKIIVGKDCKASLEEIAKFVTKSALYHSGRACISTSSIITENNGERLAKEISEIFMKIQIKDLEKDEAVIGAVRDRHKAELIADAVNQIIKSGKVIDMTPDVEIIQYHDNKVFLMPKVLYCKDVIDPIFGIEYSFPFIMIGDVQKYDLKDVLKSTLSCCVLSDNNKLIHDLLLLPQIEKIYQGFIDHCKMDFGMPHNGFLSDFLYKYKAFKC